MANSTEVKIKAAFVGLLNQTSFEQVTISDITRAAHINRGTFYLHYVDKYALLTSYEDDLASQLDQLLHELADSLTLESLRTNGIYSLNTVASIIEFVANEFGLIQVLFGPNGDPKFEPRLRRIVKDAISTAVYHIKGTRQLTPALPTEFAWELIISGLFDIIKCWLRQATPVSPKTITAIVMKTRFMTPLDMLGIEDLPTKGDLIHDIQ